MEPSGGGAIALILRALHASHEESVFQSHPRASSLDADRGSGNQYALDRVVAELSGKPLHDALVDILIIDLSVTELRVQRMMYKDVREGIASYIERRCDSENGQTPIVIWVVGAHVSEHRPLLGCLPSFDWGRLGLDLNRPIWVDVNPISAELGQNGS